MRSSGRNHAREPGWRQCPGGGLGRVAGRVRHLKSLLETGHVLPRAPWEMHAELRAVQMARNDPSPRT